MDVDRRGDAADLPPDLARLVRLADLMDTAWRVPFTRFRFGWDSVIGLVPVVGDAVGAAVGASIVLAARRHGVPGHVMVRMVGNLAADFLLGTLPVVGDAADVAFKSHRRNLRLLLRHRREHATDAEWTPAEPASVR